MILVIISQMAMFYDDTRVNLTEILYIKENLPSGTKRSEHCPWWPRSEYIINKMWFLWLKIMIDDPNLIIQLRKVFNIIESIG